MSLALNSSVSYSVFLSTSPWWNKPGCNKHIPTNVWQLSASFLFLQCFLTVQMVSETNNTNVQMSCRSRMHMPCFGQSSCPTCNFSPTWQADTTFLFFEIVFILFCTTDTSVDWYVDQVPRTCSCLLPDTCWSRLASEDSGAVTADTWIKNVANTLQADMCWLVWQSQDFCGSTRGNWIQWVWRQREGRCFHTKVRETCAWCVHVLYTQANMWATACVRVRFP